jgi:hypothetical protein
MIQILLNICIHLSCIQKVDHQVPTLTQDIFCISHRKMCKVLLSLDVIGIFGSLFLGLVGLLVFLFISQSPLEHLLC